MRLDFGQTLARRRTTCANLAEIGPEFGQLLAGVGQTCAIWAELGPCSANMIPDSAKFGRWRPNLAQIWAPFRPSMADVGHGFGRGVLPALANFRPDSPRLRVDFGPSWARCRCERQVQPQTLDCFQRPKRSAQSWSDPSPENLEELKRWETGRYHSVDAMRKLFEVADKDPMALDWTSVFFIVLCV